MPQLQGFVAQLPLRLTSPTPKPRYPKQIDHLGDHIRARRIDLGLLQKEAGRRIGVHGVTITNWELGNSEPGDRFIPALVGFLGYHPLPAAKSPGEQVRRARLSLGLSIRNLADLAGVDEASVSYIERDNPRIYPSVAKKVWRALGL